MATATRPIREDIPPGPIHRISLEVYERMVEQGMLGPSDRVVLLDGILVKKMTKGPRHSTATTRIYDALRDRLPAGWFARSEQPIRLAGESGPDSEPEPDVSVILGVNENFEHRHPNPDEVGLIVEVAASSLSADRQILAIYAAARIAEVWLVNLTNDTIEVSTDPSGPADPPRAAGYHRRIDYRPGETIPLVLSRGETKVEVAVPVVDLLGQPRG